MGTTSTFLNEQALVDLVPVKRQREIRIIYENARKQAVQYMIINTSDFNNEFDNKYKYFLEQYNF